MPFITPSRRAIIDADGISGLLKRALTIEVGDYCYEFYRLLMRRWHSRPCWTTAHHAYRLMKTLNRGDMNDDRVAARELAWQVFFELHVMPYERQKVKENGDIL
jgi:hypothetical protein